MKESRCEEDVPGDGPVGTGLWLVLSINSEDSRARVRWFLEREGYTFTVLLDTDGEVAHAYGVRGGSHCGGADGEGTAHTVPSGPQGARQQVRRLPDR